jgi:hypothetical protein
MFTHSTLLSAEATCTSCAILSFPHVITPLLFFSFFDHSGAREARLSIMVGGPEDVFRACLPLFELMGRSITHMGRAGSGQHTKMVNQILISTCMIGVCEGLLYAQKADLPLEPVLAAVGNGAAGSWSLSNYGPRILSGNFDPGFFVEVMFFAYCIRGMYAACILSIFKLT